MAYYSDVIREVRMRRRVPAEMAVCVPCGDDARTAEEATAARQAMRQTRAQARAHVPRSFVEENRRKRQAGEEAPPRWIGRGSKCCADSCGLSGRPTYYCAGCHAEQEKCSGWYHLDCFFDSHAVQLKS